MATCNVPGYRCYGCDIEFYDLQASVEVLAAACDVVRRAKDQVVLEQIEASLLAGKQQLARVSHLRNPNSSQ